MVHFIISLQKGHDASYPGSVIAALDGYNTCVLVVVCVRVRDLMRSGVIQPGHTPVWYEVFRAFPPQRDPLYVKPHYTAANRKDPVADIFYKEDKIRA